MLYTQNEKNIKEVKEVCTYKNLDPEILCSTSHSPCSSVNLLSTFLNMKYSLDSGWPWSIDNCPLTAFTPEAGCDTGVVQTSAHYRAKVLII